ncbi:MAG: hypothetical protein ACLFOA_03570 [Desulfohalobiaceae bacterium]
MDSEHIKKLPQKAKYLTSAAINAVELFVNLAMIALGLLQVLTIENSEELQKRHFWWMRTISSDAPAEGGGQGNNPT